MIRAQGVSKAFWSGAAAGLDDVTVTIEGGVLTALTGEPHAGKSTLLHILTGLKRPDAGTVHVAGVDVGALDDEGRRAFLRERVAAVVTSPDGGGCALAAAVAVVVADDPTYALPPTGRAAVIEYLFALRAPGRAVVVATHDPAIIQAADAVIHLAGGKVSP